MYLKNLSRARRTFTFRLILWYSGIFILSVSFLFALAYVLLSSSVQRKDREDIHQKLGEYAAQYRTGGLAALEKDVALERRSGKENYFFVRVAGPQKGIVFRVPSARQLDSLKVLLSGVPKEHYDSCYSVETNTSTELINPFFSITRF